MHGVKEAAEVIWRNLMKILFASSWISSSQNTFYLIMAKSGTIKGWDFFELLKAFLCVWSKMGKINKDNYALITLSELID